MSLIKSSVGRYTAAGVLGANWPAIYLVAQLKELYGALSGRRTLIFTMFDLVKG